MNNSLITLIVAVCCLTTKSYAQNVPNYIRIVGSCSDKYTALYLNSTVTAIFKSSRKELGKSKLTHFHKNYVPSQTYNVTMPDSTQSLLIEVKGYKSIIAPVYISGEIGVKASFGFNFQMIPNDSVEVNSPVNYLCIAFINPDSLKINYLITGIIPVLKRQYSTQYNAPFYYNLTHPKGWSPIMESDLYKTMIPGSYRVRAYSLDKQLLTDDSLTAVLGITFKSIILNKFIKQNPVDSLSRLPTSSVDAPTDQMVYFKQSTDELKKGMTTRLDSIAQLLQSKPGIKAVVMGYTDGVGDRDKNMVLAAQRARSVAAYLKRKGVTGDQIAVSWQGPDNSITANSSEAIKEQNRRAVISFAYR